MSEVAGTYFQLAQSSRKSRNAKVKSILNGIQLILIVAGLSIANASAQPATVSVGSIACSPAR